MGWVEKNTGIDLTIDELSDPVNKAVEDIREVGRDIDDWVNEEIPGGWLLPAAIAVAVTTGYIDPSLMAAEGATAATAAEAAAAVETAALASGATATEAALVASQAAEAWTAAQTAGATGAFDAGIGGITQAMTGGSVGGSGLTAAGLGGIDSVLGMDGLLSAGQTVGGTGLTASGAGVPGISSMGGGTGLVTGASGGGLLSAGGVTAVGATPVLGSPGSFINNPSVLGTDVIGQQGTQSTISARDATRALRAANNISNLLNPQESGGGGGGGGMVQDSGQSTMAGVDYSGLYNLLAQRAAASGLLGTQYQPQSLNLASLLG
jgi:hypothetical protein